MQKDLSWLGQLSEETLEAINADLSLSHSKETPKEEHFVRLVNGETKPGRYSVRYRGKSQSEVIPNHGNEDQLQGYTATFGGVGKRWLPIWDVTNDCIVHVPEADKPYYLGRMPNSPRAGSFVDILPPIKEDKNGKI